MEDNSEILYAAQAGAAWAIEEAAKAPKLTNQFYYDAFHDLGTERQLSMGVGPIPDSAIIAYGERYELDLLELEVFHYVIRQTDIAYLNKRAEKQRKEAKR